MKPSGAEAKLQIAEKRAMTRGSPQRRAGALSSSSPVGSTTLDGLGSYGTVLSHTFEIEDSIVHVQSNGPEPIEILDPLSDPEIIRIVDRGLGPSFSLQYSAPSRQHFRLDAASCWLRAVK